MTSLFYYNNAAILVVGDGLYSIEQNSPYSKNYNSNGRWDHGDGKKSTNSFQKITHVFSFLPFFAFLFLVIFMRSENVLHFPMSVFRTQHNLM